MLLAALVDRAGVTTIGLVAADDGAVRPIRRLSGWVNELPEQMSLSPDGRYIAYDYPESATATDRDIFVLDAHTGEQWPLGRRPGTTCRRSGVPTGAARVRERSQSLALGVGRGHAAGRPRDRRAS